MQPKTGAASACGCDQNPEASAGAGPGVGLSAQHQGRKTSTLVSEEVKKDSTANTTQQKQLVDSPVFKDIRTCSYWKRWYVLNHNFYKVPTLNPQARLQSSPIHLLIFAHKHQ